MDDVAQELAKQIDNNEAMIRELDRLKERLHRYERAVERIERVLTLDGVHGFPEARNIAREALKDDD